MNICVLLPPKRLCKYSGMVFTCRKTCWKMTKQKNPKCFYLRFCVAVSPQRRYKWAGRAIPAAAPSAYPAHCNKAKLTTNALLKQHLWPLLAYIPLVGNSCYSRSGSWSRQADEMAAANVTGKQWGTHLSINGRVEIRENSRFHFTNASTRELWFDSRATRSCSSLPGSIRPLCCAGFATWTKRRRTKP